MHKLEKSYLSVDTKFLIVALKSGALLVLIFFAFFYGLGTYALDNTNEGLYAEIAREMLVLNQYIIPHLNFVPYLEKPPLLYWLTAFCYKLLGVSELSARMVPAVSAVVVCATMLLWGRLTQNKTTGWITALILASSLGFIIIARTILFDMLLTLWITISLLCFYTWFLKRQRCYLWLLAVSLGLAFLTKGLMPLILIFSVIFIFLAMQRTTVKDFKSFFDWIALLIFLVITLPWIILASMKQAHFFWSYFVNEQILRFFNARYPVDYHTGPFYYYLPRLFIYLFPWALLTPLLIKKDKNKVAEQRALNRFMWLWFVVPLVFFTVAGEKGDYYLILTAPALAWLLAEKITLLLTRPGTYYVAHLFVLIAVIELVLLILLYLVSYTSINFGLVGTEIGLPIILKNTLILVIYWLSAYLIVGILLSYYDTTRQQISVVLIAGLVIPLIFLYNATQKFYQYLHSEKEMAGYIKLHHEQRSLFAFQDYETLSTLPFYTQKRLKIIDSQSQDLLFGSYTSEAQGWFITENAFNRMVKNQAAYVVVRDYKLPDFFAVTRDAKFCQVFHNGKFILLSNLATDCHVLS